MRKPRVHRPSAPKPGFLSARGQPNRRSMPAPLIARERRAVCDGYELSHPLARCVDGEAHIGLRVSIRNASKNEEVIFRGLATRDQLALRGFDLSKDEYSPPGNARTHFQLAQPGFRCAAHRATPGGTTEE